MTLVTRMASRTAIGAAMLIGLSAPPAEAGYVVDLTQVGSDVVASGSGRIDLTDLTSEGFPGILAAGIQPSIGFIAVASGIASAFSGNLRTVNFRDGRQLYSAHQFQRRSGYYLYLRGPRGP